MTVGPFCLLRIKVKKKVIVAMSGGVDSSTSVVMLKEQGYEVEGLTMNLWDGCHSGPGNVKSPATDVVTGARKVADELDIPFHAYDLKVDFRKLVIDPFCDEYLSGQTPNPCIICNQFLKFGKLLEMAEELGGDYLATGHYVRIANHNGHLQIQKGADQRKDQSYFLFTLSQMQLSKCIFPLGEMTKDQVRAYSRQAGLKVAEKSESQDICFIPDGDYARFLGLERDLSGLSGDIIHVSGKVLGRHTGMHQYTVGQRKGLGIGWTEPLYVVRIDAENQQVVVGEKSFLDCSEMVISGCRWNMPQMEDKFTTRCRIRYRHSEVPAEVEILSPDSARVVFKEPQFGVTPGQAAVFYDDDRVIGGGWIQ